MSVAANKVEKKYRNMYIKNELKILSYRYLVNNIKVKKSIRCLLLVEKLIRTIRFSRTRLVNYCILSGNSRWVFKKLHFARNELKKAATLGTLNGFRKVS